MIRCLLLPAEGLVVRVARGRRPGWLLSRPLMVALDMPEMGVGIINLIPVRFHLEMQR
jgi:hypothetical protein